MEVPLLNPGGLTHNARKQAHEGAKEMLADTTPNAGAVRRESRYEDGLWRGVAR